MFKLIVKLALIALVGYGAYFYFIDYNETVADVPEVSYEDVNQVAEGLAESGEVMSGGVVVNGDADETSETSEVSETDETDETSETNETIPAEFNLGVPFTSQAPSSNWDLPYQEACEEASAYMVSEYYKGTVAGQIDPIVAETAILEVVAFEEDFLGFYLDTTVAETVSFIDMFYGLSARAVENPTVDDIKTEIAAGRPVIVPAAGRELGNPNFTGAGPLYHMLVIKGYTEDFFITNDPGTRNGESYVYDIDVIMEAMGDWNNGDPANGAKRVIFISP
ncbi:MAG: C39 family peptidase [Candidatus Uhrbacteria bacterium]|nr:C39 family peptidase [Candidatus Uhrbacteria bacterium]